MILVLGRLVGGDGAADSALIRPEWRRRCLGRVAGAAQRGSSRPVPISGAFGSGVVGVAFPVRSSALGNVCVETFSGAGLASRLEGVGGPNEFCRVGAATHDHPDGHGLCGLWLGYQGRCGYLFVLRAPRG